ncbi:MAG: DotU family type IV/VI secretion system protein [Saccharospirillum sp.]|nr:DotU family type IV/VI secretion system protein [Saccharospirillum sp.]
MRLVDCFVPVLLFARQTMKSSALDELDAETLKANFKQSHSNLSSQAEQAGFPDDSVNEAWFAICAYIDELLLTSTWSGRSQWQRQPLQRDYFNTTNAGAEFYDRLNQLNKHGDDRNVREVYLLVLGLGFKGRYFDPEDRPQLEAARGFNLSLLLPEEAQRNLDQSVLFRDAYSVEQLAARDRKRRANLIPYVIALPTVFVIGVFFLYANQIRAMVANLISLVS